MILACLHWRPLREGDGEGPHAPWWSAQYAHDVTGQETTERVGGVWDALSELAREGGRWVAQIDFPIPVTVTIHPQKNSDSPRMFLGPASYIHHVVRHFVVRDGSADEIPCTMVDEWQNAVSPDLLLCVLRSASDRLVTRAAIACVRDIVQSDLQPRGGDVWAQVEPHMRTVWEWTFTEEPVSERVRNAQTALWGLVGDRPKDAREDGQGPTQVEIDAVYDAAFACDIVDRSREGVLFDMEDRGSLADRVERIRAATRDDYLIALADRAQKENG